MEKRAIFYSEYFKKKLIKMIESGTISAGTARRKYNIGGKMTISRWQKKYGTCSTLITKKSFVMEESKSTDPFARRVEELERENTLLKHLLQESDYFKDPAVKKKIAQRLSEFLAKNPEMAKNLDLPLKKFVLYSESPDKPITSNENEISSGIEKKK